MADLIFNIAKGRIGYYATLPESDDAFILIPVETTGIQADAAIRDHDTVDAVFAASNVESGIGRKTLANVAVTVDDSGDSIQVDCDDVTYTAPSDDPISSWIVAYDPDTTAGDDTSMIPLLKLDRAVTPDGNDFTLSASSGLYTA